MESWFSSNISARVEFQVGELPRDDDDDHPDEPDHEGEDDHDEEGSLWQLINQLIIVTFLGFITIVVVLINIIRYCCIQDVDNMYFIILS